MSMILGVHPVRNGLMIGAGLLTTWLFRRFRPLTRWRLSSLTSQSQRLYKREQYDEALAMARTAQQLAESHFGKASTQYQSTLFHLAAVHSAMRRNDDALEVLKECNQLVCTLHGDASLQRVPICHAMAEVHEAEGGTDGMRKAAAALQAARELRRAALGEANLSYAFSCIQEAALLVRFANDTVMLVNWERGRLADQAVGLALTAHAAAVSAGDEEEGMEFLDTLLEAILRCGVPNRLGKLPECANAIQKLRDAGAELHINPEDAEEGEEGEDAGK